MQSNTYITEEQWSKIFDFLISRKDIYIITQESIRNFLDAVFWIMRTGAQWRELPEKFGNWNSLFKRFNTWSLKGIWFALFKHFSDDPDMESVMLDSTIVRAHACAAGYKKDSAREQALGRSCGGFSCKIHALVDSLGNPLRFIFTGGNAHDVTQAESLIDGISNSFVLADKAYDSNEFILSILNKNCTPVVASKKNRLVKRDYDKNTYKERHLIECFFGKIKYFRRIFSRFDKSVRNYASFLYFASAHVWLR
jgi:transposase